jgi:hypothetical protein
MFHRDGRHHNHLSKKAELLLEASVCVEGNCPICVGSVRVEMRLAELCVCLQMTLF